MGTVATAAILFDVDDTALSSFHAMAETGFSAVPALMPHFFLATSAPALQPVLRLYRHAKSLGLVTIFVTERPAEARSATLEALNRAGFTGFRYLITRSASEGSAAAASAEHVQATAAEFKYEVRHALYQRGINIVAVVGDQAHDFAGGMAGDFQCKLPNLLYESQ
jgi:predicted secreted acid phosphatase